jgi:hypothetical protein
MKKPFLFVFALLLVALISLYFIIPQNITTTNIIKIDANDVTVAKFLINKGKWAKWWPGQHIPADSSSFTYNGVSYTIQQITNSGVDLLIKSGDTELISKLTYFAEDENLCAVSWVTQKQSSLNPFTRIAEFVKVKEQAKDLDKVLAHFKAFMNVDTNVYGIKVNVVKITQPLTLATGITTAAYPSTELVYSLAAKLSKEIAAQGGKETAPPMLNVNQLDAREYHVMVGIQTDKQLKAGNGIVVNNMVKGANLLATEVKGGRGTIENAFVQLKTYQKDHRLISPAIPFEQLVTNRLAEKDTAKWVTKIYWPIF